MKTVGLFVAAILIALSSVWLHDKNVHTVNATQETAYDRVLHTKTLRCGYADWPPHGLVKDPNTGKISGVMYDILEEIGRRLSLKIDWSENTGWSNIVSSLQSKRIDVFCAGLWVNAERGRSLTYSMPLFFNASFPFVRIDDHRFDKDIKRADSSDIRFSSIEGELSDATARLHFPKAQKIPVSQMLQASEALNNIAVNKADIIILDYSMGKGFIDSNPSTLRKLGDKPFQVFQNSLGFDIHENTLRDMINNALNEMHNQGVIANIVAKHSNDPSEFIPVAPSYLQP
ncbi:MAG: transporter substrate-binding domain-containing protein [Bdellovibrionales bacterium]